MENKLGIVSDDSTVFVLRIRTRQTKLVNISENYIFLQIRKKKVNDITSNSELSFQKNKKLSKNIQKQ